MSRLVFLTGGSGLLALNWALALRGKRPVALGIHRRSVALPDVDSVSVSLENVEDLAATFDRLGASCVVHTAALTGVDYCETHPDLAHHVNVRLAGNVARACSLTGVPLVHISTDHLFSGREAMVDEAAPAEPVNVYARSKANAEAEVLEAKQDALVLRTNFFCWGPRHRRSFSDFIIGSLREGRRITLYRDVFYTPILAQSLVEATHELVDAEVSGVLHATGDERVSKYDFGIELCAQFDLDPRLIASGSIADVASVAPRPRDMSLSNARARRLLGRNLGGVKEHIAVLHRQEGLGLPAELRSI